MTDYTTSPSNISNYGFGYPFAPVSDPVVDAAYFWTGNDPLPPVSAVAGHSQLQDISPTHYKLAKYIQYWLQTCLATKWEEYKTLASISDAEMSKFCDDRHWTFIPFDLSALTNVETLPRWALYKTGGDFENMSTELYWKHTNYYLLFIMKPIVDPKFAPFLHIANLIPDVVGHALSKNQTLTSTSTYFDPNQIIVQFGKYDIGALPIASAGKQGFYQGVGIDIRVSERMIVGDLFGAGAVANGFDLTVSTPNDGTTGSHIGHLVQDQTTLTTSINDQQDYVDVDPNKSNIYL